MLPQAETAAAVTAQLVSNLEYELRLTALRVEIAPLEGLAEAAEVREGAMKAREAALQDELVAEVERRTASASQVAA